MKKMAALATLALAVATGCGGEALTAATPGTMTITATETVNATPKLVTEPEATALESAQDAVNDAETSGQRVGDLQDVSYVDFTVEEWQATVPVSSGETISAAMVKSCVKQHHPGTTGSAYSWLPWSVMDETGSVFQEAMSWSDNWPTPRFPNGEQDGIFDVGECVRGWIYFSTEGAGQITQIRYDGAAGSLRWDVLPG